MNALLRLLTALLVGALVAPVLAQHSLPPGPVPEVQVAPKRLAPAEPLGGNAVGEVWFAAGQSQMLGVNFDRDASPGGVDRLPDNVYVLDTSDRIVPWHLPFETPKGDLQGTYENISPALTFLKTRAEAYPGRQFLLVFVVRGASGFTLVGLPSQTWAVPGSAFHTPGNLADTLLNRVALVRKKGWEPTGLLWLQGEADTPAGPSVYTFEFSLFREAVRAAAGNPDLPFFMAGIARFEWTIFPGGDLIDLAILGLTAADPFSWYVDTEDMVPQSDGLHFDSPSTRLLGKRFADIVDGALGPFEPDAVYLPDLLGGPPPLAANPEPIALTQTIGLRGQGVFRSYSEAAAALRSLESYRRADGTFHWELTWPNGERVRWRQSSNPFLVERDQVTGFAYLPDSPTIYGPQEFGGLCRTAASGLLLSVQPGKADLFTSGIGVYRMGAIDTQISLGGTDLMWTPNGVLVNSVRLRPVTN